MHLDLKHSRLNCGIVEHLSDGGCANIAEANVTDESLSDKSLHCLPSLLIRHT